MPKLTFAGHPLHPQIISFPIGLLPFSFVMDCCHLATGEKSFDDAAHYTLVGGTVGAVAAAATGAPEYFDISPGGPMKKMATTHALLNLSVLGLYAANLTLRHNVSHRRRGLLPVILSGIGTAGILFSQWFGGELVYQFGMRAKPLEEQQKEQSHEYKLPGDETAARSLRKFAETAAPETRQED